MSQIINIDGQLNAPQDAKISVLDHGFLYGDSIYETMRTYGGKIFLLDRHLQRLQNSARMLHLPLPLSVEEIETELYRTMKASGNTESYIRMVVTRGVGPIGLDIDLSKKASYIIFCNPFEPLPGALFVEGAKITLVDIRRNDRLSLNPGIKTCNLLNNVLGFIETKKAEAFEGIFCNLSGNITEGTVSNVFVVNDGVLLTPPLEAGLLPGVTRGLTLELAGKEGITVEERNFTPAEMLQSQECFLTSTTKGILPVNRIDEKRLTPIPGPVTMKLMRAYNEFVERLN